jgi:glycosyltransferase involved in cell wall biosynthesis
LDIIQSFNDPRIILINHKTNRGLIAVLNQGLKLARGRFIARMDADDISHPKRLELQIKLMEKNPSLSAVGGWV